MIISGISVVCVVGGLCGILFRAAYVKNYLGSIWLSDTSYNAESVKNLFQVACAGFAILGLLLITRVVSIGGWLQTADQFRTASFIFEVLLLIFAISIPFGWRRSAETAMQEGDSIFGWRPSLNGYRVISYSNMAACLEFAIAGLTGLISIGL